MDHVQQDEDDFSPINDSVMAHVQQDEDEDKDESVQEIIRQAAAKMKAMLDNKSRARVRGAKAKKMNEFRLSVRAKARDKARATSGSNLPPQLHDIEEYLLLCDVVDEYSAELSTTIYVTNLPPQVTEEILRAFFAQAGPIVDVYLPKDHRAAKRHRGCAFVELPSRYDVSDAMGALDMSTLFGNEIRLTRILRVKEKSLDVGANLFIGNLDADMDENKLYAIFSEFGVTVKHIKMMKDPETGIYLGSGFLNFDSYEASNRAIKAIEESIRYKYRQCRPIRVFYASMKDIEGLRHDDATPTTPTELNGPPRPISNGAVPDIFTWPPFPQHAQWYPYPYPYPCPYPYPYPYPYSYPSMQMPVPPQFSTMQHPLPQWQPPPQGMPPPQLWPSPLNMPQMMNWPAGIMSSQHLAGGHGHGHHSMMQMSMPPPPPPPPNAQQPYT